MAIEVMVQRLEIGDVVLVSPPEQKVQVEATVVREIDRSDSSVRVTLRVGEQDYFVKDWPLDELVTVVRGP